MIYKTSSALSRQSRYFPGELISPRTQTKAKKKDSSSFYTYYGNIPSEVELQFLFYLLAMSPFTLDSPFTTASVIEEKQYTMSCVGNIDLNLSTVVGNKPNVFWRDKEGLNCAFVPQKQTSRDPPAVHPDTLRDLQPSPHALCLNSTAASAPPHRLRHTNTIFTITLLTELKNEC